MGKNYIIFFLLLIAISVKSFSQSISIPRYSDIHNFIDRQEILGKLDIHSGISEYSSKKVFNGLINQFDSLSVKDQYFAQKTILKYPEYWHLISETDKPEKTYIDSTTVFYTYDSNDKFSSIKEFITPGKGIWKYFYRNSAYLSTISTNDFLLKINPVIYFNFGRDLSTDNYIFQNSRGIELSGHISNRIYFYSDILESQAAFPSYVQQYIHKNKALPGNGLYKGYNSVIFGPNSGYDFLNAQAYISAKLIENISMEFGNGRHFLGHGQRSLLLSDFSNNYLYLKFNTRVWKFHYQNLFAELIPISSVLNPGNTLIPRKYSASHYLSFKHKAFEIGLFETVIFERPNGFDLQYLNPVILYRLVEYNLDSSDNILVGLNAKYNIAKTAQIYGQLILDEFLLKELIIERNGWWANKFGIQLGAKYLNAFNIDNLDLSFEFNQVRPYTYGHRGLANYSHAHQALSHPLGSNFREIIAKLNYLVSPKISISSNLFFINQGLNMEDENFGGDILESTNSRIQDYNNDLLQGDLSSTILSQSRISYEIYHNYYLDLNILYRSQNKLSEESAINNSVISIGFRVNYWKQNLDF